MCLWLDPACQPHVDGNQVTIMLSLDNVFQCGVTRVINQLTVRKCFNLQYIYIITSNVWNNICGVNILNIPQKQFHFNKWHFKDQVAILSCTETQEHWTAAFIYKETMNGYLGCSVSMSYEHMRMTNLLLNHRHVEKTSLRGNICFLHLLTVR